MGGLQWPDNQAAYTGASVGEATNQEKLGKSSAKPVSMVERHISHVRASHSVELDAINAPRASL